MPRPVLYPYFDKTAAILLAEYDRSKIQRASANLGRNRETFCEHFLKGVLPPKLGIASGEIWDANNQKTGQIDLLIRRDDVPFLRVGSEDVHLVEGVLAVIEVKSNLTREQLIRSGETIGRVSELKPGPAGAQITSGPSLERPLRIVFAYEGATMETLASEVGDRGWNGLFDLICVLKRGVLVARDVLMTWEAEDSEHLYVPGRAAALGLLHYYLIQFGSSFLARSPQLKPYFTPFGEWRD